MDDQNLKKYTLQITKVYGNKITWGDKLAEIKSILASYEYPTFLESLSDEPETVNKDDHREEVMKYLWTTNKEPDEQLKKFLILKSCHIIESEDA